MSTRRYDIIRFVHKGENELIKTVTCSEEEAQKIALSYPSVRGYSFVGYRAKDRTEEEIVQSTERTLNQMKALQSAGLASFGGRRRYLGSR